MLRLSGLRTPVRLILDPVTSLVGEREARIAQWNAHRLIVNRTNVAAPFFCLQQRLRHRFPFLSQNVTKPFTIVIYKCCNNLDELSLPALSDVR